MSALLKMLDGSQYRVRDTVDLRQEGLADDGHAHTFTVPDSGAVPGAMCRDRSRVRQPATRRVSIGCQTFIFASVAAGCPLFVRLMR